MVIQASALRPTGKQEQGLGLSLATIRIGRNSNTALHIHNKKQEIGYFKGLSPVFLLHSFIKKSGNKYKYFIKFCLFYGIEVFETVVIVQKRFENIAN